MEKVLRKGYTTGVHASQAFKKALEAYLYTNDISICKTLKIDNDDLDVTKGCEIVVSITQNIDELAINEVPHQAQCFEYNCNKLSVYAGNGVGVVTKKGLKIAPNFPAINPAPLEAIENYFKQAVQDKKELDLKCTISVTDGKEIAKQTANEKVGVLGGISILGTTGIVKPVSSSAYIDSVQTEIEFANENGYETLYFTLGNSAFGVAKTKASEEQIVEIGNFVYDSVKITTDINVKEVVFLCGIGKMTKVYQGFKNTHNRFGTIDFKQLKEDIKTELNYEVDIESTLTVKGISQELEKHGLLEKFYAMITVRANQQIKEWFPNSNVNAVILEQKEVLGW